MKITQPLILLGILVLAAVSATPQTRPLTTKWVDKYPDAKFYNQPQIKGPLQRILTKADFESIDDYNLMIPIRKVGDYLVAYRTMKYSEPVASLSVAYGLKDNAVYVVFAQGDNRRKFSTKNNEFNLPKEVLEELGVSTGSGSDRVNQVAP